MKQLVILVAILAVGACSPSPPPANQAAAVPTAAPVAPAPVAPAAATPQKTVLDDQLKALDRARAVQQQLEEEKAKTDKAIEDSGG
ncbi:MAG: hypothetical protein ABI451_05605 [Dokdonella sp.]